MAPIGFDQSLDLGNSVVDYSDPIVESSREVLVGRNFEMCFHIGPAGNTATEVVGSAESIAVDIDCIADFDQTEVAVDCIAADFVEVRIESHSCKTSEPLHDSVRRLFEVSDGQHGLD